MHQHGDKIMKVKAMKTADTDRLIIVHGSKLLALPSDIDCRKSKTILDAYHKDWFYEYEGATYFIPPAAYIQDGEVFYISGRHRTILLERHLSEFPLLIGNLDFDNSYGEPTSRSIDAFESIRVSDFIEHSLFTLPDLERGAFPAA